MLDTSLADKPVDTTDFIKLRQLPAVYYGAVIKHEFDNQRLTIKNGVKVKHPITTLIDKEKKDQYIYGVEVLQPLIPLKVLNDFLRTKCSDINFISTYQRVLNEHSLSPNTGLGYISRGCLVIDGQHLQHVSENTKSSILEYQLTDADWFNKFASLHIFILY